MTAGLRDSDPNLAEQTGRLESVAAERVAGRILAEPVQRDIQILDLGDVLAEFGSAIRISLAVVPDIHAEPLEDPLDGAVADAGRPVGAERRCVDQRLEGPQRSRELPDERV